MTTKSTETQHDFPAGVCLPDLLLEQARRRPDGTAVIYGEKRLSNRELVEASGELAGYLRHLGVSADQGVGLFVEPSVDLMIGAWGILFAGGAYLPLSPEYPEERLRYMIEDAGVKVLFSQDALTPRLQRLAPPGTTVVTLTDVAEYRREAAGGDPPAALRSRQLAYVIYTSGSTGKPKGVMVEHHSVVNQLHWLQSTSALNAERVILQKTPMSFDAAQWEILAPACGATVVMGTPGLYRDVERLIEMIKAHQVTTLQCVPTLLQALLDSEDLAGCTSLRQIFSGGEALSKKLAVDCLAELPQVELVNLYGPTECTINTSAFWVDRAAVHLGPQTLSIGAPVDNTQYYILDEDGAPVDEGKSGELYIGGTQLARGYLHRPELTAERFVDHPFRPGTRLYRTGDLAHWNPDGTVQFDGRADHQVKLRGYRVELDEIAHAIESHDWVRKAAVVVRNNSRTGFQNLIACVELSPKEAALMDQGNAGDHHQSKASHLQVRAQLSHLGVREPHEVAGKRTVPLPGATASPEQRALVFARKTYRFFEGGEVTRAAIDRLWNRRITGNGTRRPQDLTWDQLGEVLRYFGQHLSEERLLPKYGYASPGALYATQLYLELDRIAGLSAGYYYYHPVDHQLVLIQEKADGEAAGAAGEPTFALHFMGRKRAIEPIYKNNIQEVLEIEAGHMVGLFEEVLPGYGLDIAPLGHTPAVRARLECPEEDFYLGTFHLVPYTGARAEEPTDIYLQAHPGKVADLPQGQYRYTDGGLERVSDELVQKKHVIAINQGVYERASIGITVISRSEQPWLRYLELGRKLQRLQTNDAGLGFMSAGYSSKTGHDLPAARRMNAILADLGEELGPSYFFVGGLVSEEQRLSAGMREDAVHTKGPTEMIRDDLVRLLPDYMMPNRVIVMNQLPTSANGKIDLKALAASERLNAHLVERPFVAPRTRTEERVREIWSRALKYENVSVQDDFFESEGDSLIAVDLVKRLNKEFDSALPLQILFTCPTVEKLARRIDRGDSEPASRLVRLQGRGKRSPVYLWPGLGGYTMNLRLLAGEVGVDRPVLGIQAHGINSGETPYPTIREMAAADVTAIRERQPQGPYTLWGYSFGARVAFETAYQLERQGERVENLFLIAPGSPKVRADDAETHGREASYTNPAYLTILFSVFAGTLTGPVLEECLRVVTDEESFAAFISERFTDLDPELTKRVIRVVGQTYEFTYTFRELAERSLNAPVTIFRAQGDDYSFIENSQGYAAEPPTVIDLAADHYGILREGGVGELVRAIHARLDGVDGAP